MAKKPIQEMTVSNLARDFIWLVDLEGNLQSYSYEELKGELIKRGFDTDALERAVDDVIDNELDRQCLERNKNG